MNKAAFLLLLILLPIIAAGCRQISEEEAISITRDFIHERVKFYVNEGETAPVVEEADLTVLNIFKKDGNWNIFMNIESNQTGEVKQSALIVIVDSKEGNVIDMRKSE